MASICSLSSGIRCCIKSLLPAQVLPLYEPLAIESQFCSAVALLCVCVACADNSDCVHVCIRPYTSGPGAGLQLCCTLNFVLALSSIV